MEMARSLGLWYYVQYRSSRKTMAFAIASSNVMTVSLVMRRYKTPAIFVQSIPIRVIFLNGDSFPGMGFREIWLFF